MKHLALLSLVAALAVAGPAVAAAPVAHPASVRNCHSRPDFNILISSARNMSCATAADEMRRNRHSIARRFRTTVRRFLCTRVSGVPEGGQWRCTRGHRAFRFEFGD